MTEQTQVAPKASMPPSHAKNDFQKDKFILEQLVTKDFKLKYRRSVLGIAWSVLNPLLMMVVMAIVFSTIFAQGRNGSITPDMYPLYLIVGNVTFSVMSDSTTQAMSSILGASSLLKKVKVHRWVFPVQKVLFSLSELCAFAGRRCPCYDLVPRRSQLAPDSFAGLLVLSYAVLYGSWPHAFGTICVLPRCHASLERRYHCLDVLYPHFLDHGFYCADAAYSSRDYVRQSHV